jgi:hypothetical protein
MHEFQHFSQANNHIYDEICSRYISDFRAKSGGYNLGKVTHFGEYKKDLIDKSDSLFFFSVPIKNQAPYIIEILKNLSSNCNHPFTLGLLFDNCTDSSLQLVLNYLDSNFALIEKLIQVQIFISDNELFESTCENILLQFCASRFFVSLQADIFLNDETFLTRSLKCFEKFPDLLGISARAIVSVTPKVKYLELLHKIAELAVRVLGSPFNFRTQIRLGIFFRDQKYFGDKSTFGVSQMKFSESNWKTLFIGETIIRGPIIWDSSKLKSLSGFDDVNFFLGRDDCDVSLRAKKFTWKVGYLPSTSYSIPSRGTTRKPRSYSVQKELERRNLMSVLSLIPMEVYWNLKKITFIKPSKLRGDKHKL